MAKKRYVVELFYGLNDKEKIGPYEISQILNVDESYVYFVMDDIESMLEADDEEIKEEPRVQLSSKKSDRDFQFPKIDADTEKLIERMCEKFFIMLANKRAVDVENCRDSLLLKIKRLVFCIMVLMEEIRLVLKS